MFPGTGICDKSEDRTSVEVSEEAPRYSDQESAAHTAANAEKLLWPMRFAYDGYADRSLLHQVALLRHGSSGTRTLEVWGTVTEAGGSDRDSL